MSSLHCKLWKESTPYNVDSQFPKVQLALIILNRFLRIRIKRLLHVTVQDHFKSSEQAIV